MSESDIIVKSIAFNGTDFTNFISFVKAMSTKCKQKGSTNVQLHIEDGRLVCRAVSDDLSNAIEYYVDLYDNDNGNEHTDNYCRRGINAYGMKGCANAAKYSVFHAVSPIRSRCCRAHGRRPPARHCATCGGGCGGTPPR